MKYDGLRVTWIAAISDFLRMKALLAYGERRAQLHPQSRLPLQALSLSLQSARRRSRHSRRAPLFPAGGIWADIGDTRFPADFGAVWERHGLATLPVGFRVAVNHSGIIRRCAAPFCRRASHHWLLTVLRYPRSPSQHLLAAAPGSAIVRGFVERIRALWTSRISGIDVSDPVRRLPATTTPSCAADQCVRTHCSFYGRYRTILCNRPVCARSLP